MAAQMYGQGRVEVPAAMARPHEAVAMDRFQAAAAMVQQQTAAIVQHEKTPKSLDKLAEQYNAIIVKSPFISGKQAHISNTAGHNPFNQSDSRSFYNDPTRNLNCSDIVEFQSKLHSNSNKSIQSKLEIARTKSNERARNNAIYEYQEAGSAEYHHQQVNQTYQVHPNQLEHMLADQ